MVQHFHQCRAVVKALSSVHVTMQSVRAHHMDSKHCSQPHDISGSKENADQKLLYEKKMLTQSTFPCSDDNTMMCATQNKSDY
jgi:hypothetical protein